MCAHIHLCPGYTFLKEKGIIDFLIFRFALNVEQLSDCAIFAGSECVLFRTRTLTMFELADAIMYFSAMMLFLLLEIFTSAMGYAISFLTKVENFKSQVC